MSVVTVIGSGMMGSALAFPAAENGHAVRLVGTHLDREIIENCISKNRHPKFNKDFPAGVEFYQTEDTEKALRGASLVIGGISSFGVDWFGDKILPLIPEDIPVLTVTKGLQDTEDGRLLTYPDIWEEKLASLGRRTKINSVGGPCTSYELVAHDQTHVTFCGRDAETLRKIRDIMQTDYYHISISEDVTGTESAVALKNAYALGVALTVGVNKRIFGEDSELHYNSQAAVFGQAMKEMSRLLDFQGALNEDSQALGIGDLYVTVYGGRTRLIGILLGRGMDIDAAKEQLNGVTLESLVVSERVGRAVLKNVETGRLKKEDFPLLLHIYDILTKKEPVNIPWDKFTN